MYTDYHVNIKTYLRWLLGSLKQKSLKMFLAKFLEFMKLFDTTATMLMNMGTYLKSTRMLSSKAAFLRILLFRTPWTNLV